jgi:Zn finger protein HypA/HybF involved in hydrogenase expression
MDLANMRKNGVRAIDAWCLDCDHKATVNVDDQPGHLPVKSFERRMKCGQCGSRRVDVRPAWPTKANAIAVRRALKR